MLFQPVGKVLRALWTRIRRRSEGEGRSPAPDAGVNPDGPAGQRSMVLFLRRYQRFGKRRYTEAKEFLEDLVQFQAECRRPVYLVPMGILWGKGPEKVKKGILDVLLGRKDAPGRLRQVLVLFRYSRNSLVTMGQVMNLKAYRKENIHLEQDLLLKKIRWNLHRELDLAKKQITGPRIKPRKYIIESILSSRTLRDQAREIARAEGKPFEKIMKRAEKYADEIAADYRITYIEFLSLLLSWVWNNIYSGFSVDMKGLERVKAAVRKGSVILMPSHKSHVDYLVLSYVFYQNDLPPPHIAAGVNLSFWPLGHIFRRAGAFFIRRSIRGQKLYATVFSTYLRKLLREGHVQEFFLEGTRSRTGKLLQPKLGMLSMELDAFGEGVSEDLQLVPISITYEKIVEESSYTKELGGGRKEKEGFLGLLKTSAVPEEEIRSGLHPVCTALVRPGVSSGKTIRSRRHGWGPASRDGRGSGPPCQLRDQRGDDRNVVRPGGHRPVESPEARDHALRVDEACLFSAASAAGPGGQEIAGSQEPALGRGGGVAGVRGGQDRAAVG